MKKEKTKRMERVWVCVTEEEQTELEDRAKELGLSLGSYVRMAALVFTRQNKGIN